MNWDEYQKHVADLWMENPDPVKNIDHCVFGLLEETGEVAGLFKRLHRGDNGGAMNQDKLTKEMGDVIYYWTKLCMMFDLDPREVLQQNIEKLLDRKARNVLTGSGDNR